MSKNIGAMTFSEVCRRAGSVKSAKKKKAVRANLKKAREALAKKRRAQSKKRLAVA